MAPIFNPLTGKKRRQPRRELSRKKRASLACTVSAQMYSQDVLRAYVDYISCLKTFVRLFMLVTLFSSELGLSPTDADTISTTILVGTVHCFISALKMLEVDSNLMDLSNETIETLDSSYNAAN